MIASVAWTLLAAAAAAAAGEFRLTVLHTNDMHSHYEETCDGQRCTGGFARLRAALDAERARAAAAGAPAVYLVAGDTFQGTEYYNVLGWQPAADLLGHLGVDAMCLGNHEFEDGPENLAPFLKSENISSIPIVVTNIDTRNEPCLTNIRPSVVLKIGGHTIGVVGYLTQDTEYENKVGKVTIADEVSSIAPEVLKLRKSGVDIVIALGHSGLQMDKRVAREVDGVDVVIGGHSHTYLCTGPKQDTEIPAGPYPVMEKRDGRIVPVVQAYAFAKYLGKLVLSFDGQNRLVSAVGEPILLDHTVPQDANTLEKVEHYKQMLAERQVKELIGETIVHLDGSNKCAETNLGDMIADSFIRFNLKNLLKNGEYKDGWTDASIAILLCSGIKSSINPSDGKIYSNDMIRVLPYKTPLYKITISGKTLLKALEHSAYLYDYNNCAIPEQNIFGGFIQMAGLHVTYDMKRPAGLRVQSVTVQCAKCLLPSYEPIDVDKQYRVITTKYVIKGGDGYTMIKNELIDAIHLNVTENEVLQTYIKEMSPIYAELKNRIQILS